MSEMFSQALGIGVAQGLAQSTATVLLVDGENIPQALAGQIIGHCVTYGRPTVQRVYGDVIRLPSWAAAADFEMVHTGHAKNGADMRMVIDALDLVHRGGVGRVMLASSDRDFTHLAQNLRAKGIEVIGMGESKTHESFRKACSRFIELKASPAPAPKQVLQKLVSLDHQIAQIVGAEGQAGVLITALSAQMRSKFGFLIGQHEKKNWRGYLAAHPTLYDLDPKGPTARVRLK